VEAAGIEIMQTVKLPDAFLPPSAHAEARFKASKTSAPPSPAKGTVAAKQGAFAPPELVLPAGAGAPKAKMVM
jgi:hypothetical protein